MVDSVELSERELEILQLVATGASNKEIAQHLFISANTVKVHLRNIFAKIEVTSRTEAAMYAVSAGLVEGAATPVDEDLDEEIVEDGLGANLDGDPRLADRVSTRELSSIPRQWILAGIIVILITIASTYGIARGYIFPQAGSTTSVLPNSASSPRWQTMSSLPTARSGLALTAYDNSIYSIGGLSAQGVTGVVERYDPDSNSWTTLDSKPTPVDEISAGLIGGKVYIPGGMLATGMVTNTLEYYDPREDRWEQGAPMPQALSGYALVAFEGKLYVFGGWDGQTYLDTVYEYDPTQDVWTEKDPMPESNAFAGAVVAGGRIYIIGGYDGRKALRTNYLYSPEDEARGGIPWQKLSNLPLGRYAMGIASIADIIYIVGGESESKALPYLEYLIPRNEWATFESLDGLNWSKGGLAILGSNLHILGGIQGEALTNQHLAYKAVYIINMPVIR